MAINKGSGAQEAPVIDDIFFHNDEGAGTVIVELTGVGGKMSVPFKMNTEHKNQVFWFFAGRLLAGMNATCEPSGYKVSVSWDEKEDKHLRTIYAEEQTTGRHVVATLELTDELNGRISKAMFDSGKSN